MNGPSPARATTLVTVRRMTADDIDQATAVLREHDPDQDSGEWVARLGRDVAAAVKHPVVAVVRGEVVGYARTMPFQPEGDSPADAAPGGHYMLGLVVAPAHRRRGLAGQVHQPLEQLGGRHSSGLRLADFGTCHVRLGGVTDPQSHSGR